RVIVRYRVYRNMGNYKNVRHMLSKLKVWTTFKIPYFSVEHTLDEDRMPDVSDQEKLRRLEEALETTERLGTLYQRCQVLTELAAIHISMDEKPNAQEYSKRALQLARKQGYKLL